MKDSENKKKIKKISIVVALVIAIVIIVVGTFVGVNYSKVDKYNKLVKEYNEVATEYNKIVKITSVDNIKGMTNKVVQKERIGENIFIFDFISKVIKYGSFDKQTKLLKKETDDLIANLLVMQQITNPKEKWVKERLKSVKEIKEVRAVTKENDPNKQLGKGGGYTACIYFSVDGIKDDSIKGKNLIEKGTDAGGAIEVYATCKDAKNRCEYLSEFDGTLLYTGSYAIVGTVVIRTSYMLTNEQQRELTSKITCELTALR